jgi:hypothetical protein
MPAGRGLHSFTSQLNLSRFLHGHTPYEPPNTPMNPLNNPSTHPPYQRKGLS